MLGKKFTQAALVGGTALSLAVAALALPGTSQAGSNPFTSARYSISATISHRAAGLSATAIS